MGLEIWEPTETGPSIRLNIYLFLQKRLKPQHLTSTSYIHFTLNPKPWEPSFATQVLPRLTTEAQMFFRQWKESAEGICGFEQGWPKWNALYQDVRERYEHLILF